MNEAHRTRLSWKRLQTETASWFDMWLEAGRRDANIVKIQKTITNFLISHLRTQAAAQDFVSCWPKVFGASCNDPKTYNDFTNVLAYVHVHFLERYRRFYQVLERLYSIGQLPMRNGPVRVLDIGTGPAHCLYALQDFYNQLNGFAEFSKRSDLKQQPLELRCVEESQAMRRFMHHFSERAFRPGPFSATHLDFLKLDLAELRSRSELESRESQRMDWDDPNATWPHDPVDYKHDLYVFSNFFTRREFAEVAEEQLKRVFYWLGPGHRVIVMGASGKPYDGVYEVIEEVARETRVDHVLESDVVIACKYDDFSASRVRTNYNEVLWRLLELNPKLKFPVGTPDELRYPTAPMKGPRSFKALVYKRTRLLPGRRWHRP